MSNAAAVTLDQFRLDFPEFADTTAYPDASINFYLLLASNLMDPIRWGDLLVFGVELYVAHQITLARIAALQAARGPNSVAGVTTGVVTSRSIGPVSKSVDVATFTKSGAGSYNLTVYGVQYASLLEFVGIGGMQL